MATKAPVTANAMTTTLLPINTSSGNFSYTKGSMDFVNSLLARMHVTYAFLAVLSIGCCLLMIVVLLSSPSLRSGLRNHLLLSLTFSYLLIGIMCTPLVADFASYGRWRHGCYLHIIGFLLYTYIQNFVSEWTIVLLILHYVARIQHYEGPVWLVRLPALLQRALPAFIVVLPWVVSLIIIVPVSFAGLHPRIQYFWTENHCPMLLTGASTNLLSCLTYYIPAIGLTALSIGVVVLWRRRRAVDGMAGGGAEGGSMLVGSPADLEGPIVYVVTAGLAVLLLAPKYVGMSVIASTRMYWKTLVTVFWVTNALNDALLAVHVVVWFVLFKDVRDRLLELVTMVLPWRPTCCQSRSPPQSSGNSSVPPVSFKNVSDE